MFEECIRNIEHYNEGMRKSLFDKLFFVDKINSDLIVDYGCADGSLLAFIKSIFPSISCRGYDTAYDMIKLASEKFPHILFSSDWNLIIENIKQSSSLVLSSVIHEVYSYGTSSDIEIFWKNVFNSGFKYIIIRDLIPSKSINKPSDLNDVVNIYRSANKKMIYEFESLWGSIESNKNLLHFLMKYRYDENWNRELKENYYPIYREELFHHIPPEYSISFHEHYILPFTKNKVKEDFGITIKDNTHLKLILERNI